MSTPSLSPSYRGPDMAGEGLVPYFPTPRELEGTRFLTNVLEVSNPNDVRFWKGCAAAGLGRVIKGARRGDTYVPGDAFYLVVGDNDETGEAARKAGDAVMKVRVGIVTTRPDLFPQEPGTSPVVITQEDMDALVRQTAIDNEVLPSEAAPQADVA